MKKIFAIAVAMLLATSTFAQNGRSIYNKYSESENVSAVYISPAMFKMIGKLPEMEIGNEDMDLTPIIQSLTGLYLIDSENGQINESIKNDVETLVKNGKYELMMEVKDDGEIVKIYTTSKGDMVSSLVMLVYEKNECMFICIDGQMSQEMLNELIAKAAA